MMTVGDDHCADAVASQPGAGALPVASSPSNKSLTVVNEDFGDQAAHEGRDQADRGEYRQAAGAVAEALTRPEGGNIRDGGLFY
jgi:hypothetical protein